MISSAPLSCLITDFISHHYTTTEEGTYFLKYLHRDVKEKVKILKNLANYELPTEELNEYIQASDGSDLLHCVFVNTKQ